MTIVFKAKTADAHILKLVGELLQNNIRIACFEISHAGIKLRMHDHQQHILIDLVLEADNFTLYKYRYPSEKMFIGINLNHFYKMLKTIKKKDSITLFIDDSEPTDLGIQVFPKENNTRVTTSKIKIQAIQSIEPVLPSGYGKPVIVPSAEYQKMTKEMNSIGSQTLKIFSKGFYIKFLADAGSIYSKVVTFGELLNDDDDEDDEENNPEYEDTFDIEKLVKITKIAGLSQIMQIYPKAHHPLLFRSHVGSLGRIAIYVKSKAQIEAEEKEVVSEDEDDEEYVELRPIRSRK